MSDSLLNMKAFVATARSGSFSEAARQLRLAPSVVTKRVTQLEWSLKCKLLRRSTRRLQLTEVGERYLETMQQIVREYDEMAAGVKRSPDEIEGQIRIKAPGSQMAIDLCGLLATFQTKYPRITLDALLVDRTVNPVEEGFDIVLTMMPSSFHGVIEEPLLAYPRVLCAAPSYLARRGQPRHVRDLADHDCLVFAPMGQVWTFDGKSGLTTVAVRPRLLTNNHALLVECLSAGGGIAIASRAAMASRLRSGALIEVLPEVVVPDLWVKALVPTARANLARVQTLLSTIRDAFREAGQSAHLGTG
ncbi:putative Transcriptional regulatory protein (LysR substrate binding domain) [Bradyrhizobium sp. ORS 375]|nr:putative Transcriptional regulatory protein (LysR substrate binding domain) [Bradyrhizobium sp. ORS 375]